MDNSEDVEIVQKVPLKQKLEVKLAVHEKTQVMIAQFGHQDSLAALGCGDGFVRIYNLVRSNKMAQFNTNIKDKESNSNTPVNCIRWRPISQKVQAIGTIILAANTNGHLFQFIAKTGKQLWHSIQHDNQIFALDYASDGRNFASAGRDTVVRVYDQQTKKIVNNLKGQLRTKPGHNNRVFSLKFKPQNINLLASGGWDQNVHIWDLRVGQVTQTLVGPRITGDGIDFREDMILTASNRVTDQLQLWDYRTKQVIHNYIWDETGLNKGNFLNACKFCPNSKNTIIAAGSQQMKMFTLDDHTELFEFKAAKGEALYTCDSSGINNKYLVGGKNGNLYYLAPNKGSQ